MKLFIGCLVLTVIGVVALAQQTESTSVLIVTGGHEFEREAFFNMFTAMPNVEYHHMEHPQANEIYASPELEKYDVLVYYDMNQDISESQKQAFLDMVQQGKGLVFLHHSLASYQEWDAYLDIQGGRYHLEPEDKSRKSTYKHDVQIDVNVVDSSHPVTRGLQDCTIHDEVYGNFQVLPTVQPLLKTDHPESGDTLAWAHTYGNSNIVYIQLGHDHHAYENAKYQRLVRQAIQWAAE